MSNGFADTFVEEGREHLTDIENNLIALEDNPDDEEAMNQVFRSAHTLKGNAGAMGFDGFGDLAHEMEDVLDEIRDGNIEVTSDVMDVLFDASDILREMLEEVDDTGDTESDPTEEVEALQAILDEAEEGGENTDEGDESADDGADEGGKSAEDDDPEQCVALTQSDDRCQRNAKDGERYCGQHLAKIEEEGPDAVTDYDDTDETARDDYDVDDYDDADALLEQVDTPDETVAGAYHAVLTISGSEDANENVLEAIEDAFDVLATIPPTDLVRDDYAGSFGAILAGNIDSSDEISGWFGGMDGVEEIEADEITGRVDWAEPPSDVGSSDSDDEEEIEDIDDIDDDLDVDDLDSLVGTGEFDEVEDVDEDMVDDVELGMDEVGEAGTFHQAEVEDSVDDDETVEDEDEDDSEVPDNKGARIFDELEDEVDEADDFDEIEEEMEEMGFNDEFDEMDDEEVEFDELVDSDPDGFDFDEGEADDEATAEELLEDELDTAAEESTPGLFGDDADERPDEEDESESPEVDTDDVEAEAVSEDEEVDVDVDTGVSIGEERDVGGDLLDEDSAADSSGDPFSSDETESKPEPEPEPEMEPEPEPDPEAEPSGGVDADLGGEEVGTGGDLFDSEFDDSGSVDFDDLLEQAGQEAAQGDDAGESIDSIRVDVDQLDELYSLVQELVTSRIRLRRAIADGASGETMGQAFDELDTLETITTRMQDTVMDIRLVRLDRITERLPRVVRDTARDNDKDIDFEIEGEDVELDRAILEQLGDPLMHIVRNAVDHGIEDPDTREQRGKSREGSLKLSARRTRDRVTIKIEDDGGGINPNEVRQKAIEEGILTEEQAQQLGDDQALELIFHPGFSTSNEVSETSGRGVGLDVVYTTVRSLDGSVDVSSTPGEGTTFTLRLPVSLAIDEVLLIESGDEEYGIPIKNISEITGVRGIEEVNGQESHIHNEEVYPIIRLSDALDTTGETGDEGRLIRIDKGVRQIAIHCDNVIESTEVVVEPYDGVLRTVPGLSGAAVLGEGDVVNILDVERL